MTIQPIGAASVALYITPADLREHGLTPAQLTLEQALELTQTAFTEAGIALDGAIEIEAYPNACGVLVFARIRVPERLWLSFDDCEDLISAAQALTEPCPEAALLWCDGRWWLSLPAGQERLAGFLSEFGRSERPCPYLDARLAEHGRPILERDALAALLRHFPAALPAIPIAALPPV
ncbi:conserved hypothetical protein [uncultured Eubacteriales bacterium]|uniref:Adaptor protein n=1 Tax=uncultured Eubacteriales bacterium TaxID=172733 RepID=A0A212J1R8_9FIRM|nr:conserved hypothetical protein [uncultured Eubacteriales bacterium]